jgi:O-antigen ligase
LLSSNIKRLCFGLIDKKTLILILSLICAIPVVAMFSKGLAINRLTKSFILGSNAYESMEVRFDLWLRSVGLWTDNIGAFFLGYGSQSIPNLIGSPTADSFYLDHALSEGLLGLMLLLALVITPALQVWSAGHLTREASLGILVSVVALTVSLTGNVLVDPLYGGVTFSLLYGLLSVYGSRNSSLGYSKR